MYKTILKDAEFAAEEALRHQVMDGGEFDGGAFTHDDIAMNPGSGLQLIAEFIVVYANKDSKFFKCPTVYEHITRALDFCLRVQRENGTFDLAGGNVLSAPDTAFSLHRLVRAWRCLKKVADSPKEQELLDKLLTIMTKMCYGVREGGFHTPNHRWAICAALSMMYTLTGDKSFLKRVDDYMIEGIDCNEDGEFAERSAGTYNVVNDNAMITVAQELGRTELYQYASRNLQMMLSYFEPDRTIFTMNSTRQDYGTAPTGEHYIPLYLTMGKIDGNKQFIRMAVEIFESAVSHNKSMQQLLWFFMLNEDFQDDGMYQDLPEIPHQEKLYVQSGIMRATDYRMSLTLMKDRNTFLYIKTKTMDFHMRMGVNFFYGRNAKMHTLEAIENGYRLVYDCPGFYRLPFKEKPETSDWWKMDQSKREIIEPVHMNITVDVTHTEKGVHVHYKASGCAEASIRTEIGVPAQLPSNVRGGERGGSVMIDADSFACRAEKGMKLIPKKGMIAVKNTYETMSIGPAFCEHYRTASRADNIDQPSPNHTTLFFTDFAESERDFDFILED